MGRFNFRLFGRGFGIAFFVWGVALLAQSAQITGFSVIEDLSGTASSILGLVFVVVGIALFLVSKSKRAGIAGLVALLGASAADHEEAHNAAKYHNLRESYASQDRENSRNLRLVGAVSELREKYGTPPDDDDKDKEQWVTLYHAYPRNRGFKFADGKFIDEKKIKGGGFFLANDPRKAQEELPGLYPSDISIMRVRISKKAYDDLDIQEQTSNFSSEAYKLPKQKIGLANDLYNAGHIIVEENGRKHSPTLKKVA